MADHLERDLRAASVSRAAVGLVIEQFERGELLTIADADAGETSDRGPAQ